MGSPPWARSDQNDEKKRPCKRESPVNAIKIRVRPYIRSQPTLSQAVNSGNLVDCGLGSRDFQRTPILPLRSGKFALCRRTPTSALLPLLLSARNVRDYLPQASHHDSRLREEEQEQEQEKQTQLEGQEAAPPEEPTRRAHSPHASTTGQPRRQTRRNSSAVRPRTEHRDRRGMP